MNIPRKEQLTNHFYEWESRGRGWHWFEFPVELEPEFYPFFGHYVPNSHVEDDGIRPTIFTRIGNLFRSKKRPEPEDDMYAIPPVVAYMDASDEPLCVYSIVLPKDQKQQLKEMQQLLVMLSYTERPISFEIIATSEAIRLQVACAECDAAHVCGQIKAYIPAAILTKNNPGLELLNPDAKTSVIDFGLADEFMRPLCQLGQARQDPFIGLFAALENLQQGERAVLQILFKGASNPWAESIIRSVTDNKGGSFFADAPEMVKLAQTKVSTPLFAVCMRVIGQAKYGDHAISLATTVARTFVQITRSDSNSLRALSQNEELLEALIDDVYLRQSHRLGMILSAEELATVVHFPSSDINSTKLERDTKRTKAAPSITEGNGLVLGMNIHQGVQKLVSITPAIRLRHMHVIGSTGTGKSTFLLNIISEDITAGRGLCVLDPHGDLIESILGRIPANRINDVIVIDPADGDFPVGFNILSAHSEIEREILSSDLVAVFRRLSTSWGDQMNSVLANAILAFLESSEGGTLSDLRRFLLEPSYRTNFLKTVSDPNIVYYWQHSFPILKSNSLGSILTRLDTFLRPKLIRNMVVQRKSLDFESIMDTSKIVLVKLSQGLIGTENSYLLGSFIVSKIYQAAMARQAKSKAQRSDFFLFIDEFQNFITPSMSAILSGARKYHLGLILVHQEMQQIQKYDSELASAVITNPATRICFRLGDIDAKKFEDGFSYFVARDLQDLKMGEAIVRIDRPEYDFNLAVTPLPEPEQADAESTTRAVIAKSREVYGTPRHDVEASLEYLANTIPKPDKAREVKQERLQKELEQVQPIQQEVPHVPVEISNRAKLEQKTETQHRYLQMLIKKMAESRGYKASIEELTPDGKGRVDISLERNDKRIACEVSVTTSDLWEAHNVEKCLNAGYDVVIVCSEDMRNLERIKKQVQEKLSKTQQEKVLVLERQEVFHYFDSQVVQETTTEKIVKGYRVKVEFDTTSSYDQMNKKQKSVVKTVTESRRKTKN